MKNPVRFLEVDLVEISGRDFESISVMIIEEISGIAPGIISRGFHEKNKIFFRFDLWGKYEIVAILYKIEVGV